MIRFIDFWSCATLTAALLIGTTSLNLLSTDNLIQLNWIQDRRIVIGGNCIDNRTAQVR